VTGKNGVTTTSVKIETSILAGGVEDGVCEEETLEETGSEDSSSSPFMSIGVEQMGDYTGEGPALQNTDHIHMDRGLPHQRRRGT
jgi:hypothetical protein